MFYTVLITIIIFAVSAATNWQFLNFIDDMFVARVNGEIDKTILGDILFRLDNGSRLSHVQYFKNEQSSVSERIPLTQLVDISTWKRVGYNGPCIEVFEDRIYIYNLCSFSGEIDLKCYPKYLADKKSSSH